jgi:hypothetical protein
MMDKSKKRESKLRDDRHCHTKFSMNGFHSIPLTVQLERISFLNVYSQAGTSPIPLPVEVEVGGEIEWESAILSRSYRTGDLVPRSFASSATTAIERLRNDGTNLPSVDSLSLPILAELALLWFLSRPSFSSPCAAIKNELILLASIRKVGPASGRARYWCLREVTVWY